MTRLLPLLLLLTGCATPSVDRSGPFGPPMYQKQEYSAAPVQPATNAAPQGITVTIAWENLPNVNQQLCETFILASTNLHDWALVSCAMCQQSNRVVLLQRPPHEFYWAYNRLINL